MTRKIATFVTLAALSVTPAVAFAQTAPNPTTPPAANPTSPLPPAPAEKMPDSMTTPAPNAAPAAPNSTATTVPSTPRFVSEQSADQILGSDLIGTDVVTANDEKLGSISDIVVNKDGSVGGAVIDVGGFLGIGAKPVAVSFESLTMAPTENGTKIVVALSKEELNAAPQFRTLDEVRQASNTTRTQ